MAKRTGINKKNSAYWNEHPMTPRLMPLKMAADYMGLTVWALRERIWAGQIPVVQFPGGRKQYIDIEDIDRFIVKNKRTIV